MDLWRIAAGIAAVALWTSAITLMVVALVETGGMRVTFAAVSLLLANGAVMCTGWLMLLRHRRKIMDYLAHQDLRMAQAVNVALRGDDPRPRKVTPIR